MVTQKVKTMVRWLPNGRKMPPTPPRYSTLARFYRDGQSDMNEAWSIVLDFDKPPDDQGKLIADIRFLSPDAPQALLSEGSQFALYEGAQKVAEGTIIFR
jgi:hypothetical protein